MELSISFFIKVHDRFYAEAEIAQNLPKLKQLAKEGVIDLQTTDGAISIKSVNGEILGTEYWDEIYWALHDILYQLDKLVAGEVLTTYFPMHSRWLQLQPDTAKQTLHLTFRNNNKQSDVSAEFPLIAFLQAFLECSIKLMRVLDALGADFAEVLASGHNIISPDLQKMLDMRRIFAILNDDIVSVLEN